MSDTLRRWKGACVLVLVAWTGSPLRAEPPRLSGTEQERVNQAIDAGERYLLKNQKSTGTWAPDKGHQVGHTALAALTLLECGALWEDESIQRAAAVVRQSALTLDTTYELSLAILFLHRLGLPRDRPLIQAFALRLIAGQHLTGGWSYTCPVLTPQAHQTLLTVLRQLESRPHFDPVLLADGKSLADLVATTSPGNSPGATAGPALAPAPTTRPNLPRPGWCVKMEDLPLEPKDRPDKLKPIVIPRQLLGLPVLLEEKQLRLREDDKAKVPMWGPTDNSNTQFATLALWSARRYDIPMKRTLNLLVLRYRTSQNQNGSWGYRYRFGGGEGESAPMTCAGLLGLGVGNGIAQDGDQDDPNMATLRARDPRLVNGLVALTKHVGAPAGRMEKLPQPNLYFLWSVERVGVLFGLPKIGDKDWYRWAAETLVANQKGDGNWTAGGYPGAHDVLDTCLALLILKKADLATDLSDRLSDNSNELTKVVEQRLNIKPDKPPEPPPTTPPQQAVTEVKQPPPDPKPTDTQAPSATQPANPASLADEGTDSDSDASSSGGKQGLVILLVVLLMLFVGGVITLLIVSQKQPAKVTVPVRKKRRVARR